MLNNSMLPFIGVVNIMKIKQDKIHEGMYGYKVWFNGLNTPTHVLFIWNQMLKFRTFTIYNHDVGQELQL